MFSHKPAHLKLHCSLSGDFDAIESLRILRDSGRSCSGLEDPEIPELQAVVLTQFPGYLVKEGLDYALYRHSFRLRALGDPIDKFFLSDCCHRLPHFSKEQLGSCVRVYIGKVIAGRINVFALSPRHIIYLTTLCLEDGPQSHRYFAGQKMPCSNGKACISNHRNLLYNKDFYTSNNFCANFHRFPKKSQNGRSREE